MPWHKRDKALAAARRYLAVLSETFTPMQPYTRTRVSDVEKAKREAEWADKTRTAAQALADVLGPDPDAAAHVATMLEATS